MIDEQAETLRAWLKRVVAERYDGKMLRWTRAAGVSEGAPRNFLKGTSQSLNTRTVQRLAAAADIPSPPLGTPRPGPKTESIQEIGQRLDQLREAFDEIATLVRRDRAGR